LILLSSELNTLLLLVCFNIPNSCFHDAQYVARHPGKNATMKDRSIYTLVPSQGDQHISSKASNMASSDGKQTLDENGSVDVLFKISCVIFLFFGFYFMM